MESICSRRLSPMNSLSAALRSSKGPYPNVIAALSLSTSLNDVANGNQ